jgi:O-antigen ligase
MLEGGARSGTQGAERAAQALLLLFIVSIPFMQPPIPLLGFQAVASDFLFLALAAFWGMLVLLRRTPLVLDRAWWFVGAYFAAMLASAAARGMPPGLAVKLLTQAYLVAIPVIVCSLLRDEAALRRAVLWWLAGSAVVAAVAIASLGVFVIDPHHPLLRLTRFYTGTLPPGDYPRLRMTFLNGNLACNYLTVSLALLLAARHLRWVGKGLFVALTAGLLVSAATTISPGLGGVALALGLWLWLLLRERRPAVGRAALIAGAVAAVLVLPAMALTPILHRTAPFLIPVPALHTVLAPAGRLMTWMDATRNFLSAPLLGRGIGADAVKVAYLDPAGHMQHLTDAHNMFLNIAAQCGLVGVAALVALVAHMVRRTLPLRLPRGGAGVIRLAAGLGLLNGLVYQGLGGSFEDSRHLWLAFGLLLASSRIERRNEAGEGHKAIAS